jgi:hypothetical protein
MRLMKWTLSSFLAAGLALAACDSTGSNGQRDSGPPAGQKDLTAGPAAPDLMAPPGSCFDLFDCYYSKSCAYNDQACLNQCNVQYTASAAYLTHASAYWRCVADLLGATCRNPCNEPGDMGIADCQMCLLGTCDSHSHCTGGPCSDAQNACANDP